MPRKKFCFVPSCKNNNEKTPTKIFVSVPKNEERRRRWFKAVKIDVFYKSTHLLCCEDHFNLEEDAQNWTYYKMMGSNLILKSHVVPHKLLEVPTKVTIVSSSEKKRKLENFNSSVTSYSSNFVDDPIPTTETIDIKEEPILGYESSTSQIYSSDNNSTEFDTTGNLETFDTTVKLETLDDFKSEESLDDPEFNNECIEFGNYVATELEKLTDFNSFLIAKQCIKSVILAAQKGLYKNGLPCTNNILPVPTDCTIKMEPVDT